MTIAVDLGRKATKKKKKKKKERLMFHRKSAEMLNLVDYNSFLDLFSLYPRTFEFFFKYFVAVCKL